MTILVIYTSGNWGALCFDTIRSLCHLGLFYDFFRVDISQVLMVPLHYVLHFSILYILWNDDSSLDSKLPYYCNRFIKFLFCMESLLWFHYSSTCKAIFSTLDPFINFFFWKWIELQCWLQLEIPLLSDPNKVNSLVEFWKHKIPIWWRWYYWETHVSWTLYGLIASQLGDVETEMETVDGKVKVGTFIKSYFGMRRDFLAPVMVCIPIVFALLIALAIKHFNFQKR